MSILSVSLLVCIAVSIAFFLGMFFESIRHSPPRSKNKREIVMSQANMNTIVQIAIENQVRVLQLLGKQVIVIVSPINGAQLVPEDFTSTYTGIVLLWGNNSYIVNIYQRDVTQTGEVQFTVTGTNSLVRTRDHDIQSHLAVVLLQPDMSTLEYPLPMMDHSWLVTKTDWHLPVFVYESP